MRRFSLLLAWIAFLPLFLNAPQAARADGNVLEAFLRQLEAHGYVYSIDGLREEGDLLEADAVKIEKKGEDAWSLVFEKAAFGRLEAAAGG